MKRTFAVLFFLALAAFVSVDVEIPSTSLLTGQADAQQPNPACVPPMQAGSSMEQTAWQLFVAATCPVNNTQYPYVTWEKWIEQAELYKTPGAVKAFGTSQRPRFHMSPLARIVEEKRRKGNKRAEVLIPQAANEGCNSNTWSKRTICEEARINPDAQSYIVSQGLVTKKGQIAFINAKKTFDFTAPAVEIKADWIKLNSCSSPPKDVHVEQVNGSCYALGGIHLISKLIDKWIWATFEPQNTTTNPQRCVVLGCNDPWGSNPPTTQGSSTQLTAALADLMTQANLAPEWRNYRLDGVQTDFLSDGKPTRLGNSIIEGDNAALPAGGPATMKVSSCITCHNFSTINTQGDSMTPDFIIGKPTIKPGYDTRDFVWSLALAR
jgi:hypothetical protein